MDLIDQLRDLSEKIPAIQDQLKTEEATKAALVLPFIAALGYDVFDPRDVVPEFTADIGTKQGERVDYAILSGGKPIMLIECKKCGVKLDSSNVSQLLRYFMVTDARFGVLTNGIVWRFYSDLEQTKMMDDKPFLEFNLLDIRELLVEELRKFSRSEFNIDNSLATAAELKYTQEIKRILERVREPF